MQLSQDETRIVTLSVDFNESSSMGVELQFNRSQTVKVVAPLGDILNPVRFSTVDAFLAAKSKLTGMNEIQSVITIPSSKYKSSADSALVEQLYRIVLSLANVCTNRHLPVERQLLLSGCTLKFKSMILVIIDLPEEPEEENLKLKLTVNCEKMVLGSMLSKLIKDECVKSL